MVISLAAVPAGIIAATATFGVGLVIIPMFLWYGYRNVFKLPKMLGRKRWWMIFQNLALLFGRLLFGLLSLILVRVAGCLAGGDQRRKLR